ncbi:MAG: asparagine synthase (glutamine-hydrolyzing) [Sulfurifustis sp.]
MCGIVGQVVPNGARTDRTAVANATSRIAHRGPDGSGITEFSTACFGHRRLSIIDVAGSPQPWSSEDGRYTIVFNGEIYNYVELRKELIARGVSFRSQGDTEVLLAAFICYGERCLEKLNGMFAFAVWDESTRELFIGRDRVGKKPLYYAITGGALSFASEIEALFAFAGIDRTLDEAALQDFFAYQFIPAPRTIYRGIRKLPAAHYLRYRNGRVDTARYWTPPLPEAETESYGASCERLRTLLEDAVRLRLRSDVPLGAFLSGGLDSTIVVSIMNRLGVTVDSFHVGFAEESFDETEHAEAAARAFGARHHSRQLPLDCVPVLDAALRHFGEPFADPSAIPTWHLCRTTREAVTVALSGDGADEIFAGYRRYYARRYVRLYLTLPQAVRRHVSANLLHWLPESQKYYGNSWFKQLRLFIQLAERSATAPNDWLAQTFSPDERRALFLDPTWVGAGDPLADFGCTSLDDVSRMIYADLVSYLPEDILVKVDRMSMAHALEVRNPFLDYRVVELACRLPLSHKLNGSTQKRILRDSFEKIVPASLLARPKHGFAVPLGDWFRTILKTDFDDTVLHAGRSDFFNYHAIGKLWRDHQRGAIDNGFKLWSLFVFHRWYHAPSVA